MGVRRQSNQLEALLDALISQLGIESVWSVMIVISRLTTMRGRTLPVVTFTLDYYFRSLGSNRIIDGVNDL